MANFNNPLHGLRVFVGYPSSAQGIIASLSSSSDSIHPEVRALLFRSNIGMISPLSSVRVRLLQEDALTDQARRILKALQKQDLNGLNSCLTTPEKVTQRWNFGPWKSSSLLHVVLSGSNEEESVVKVVRHLIQSGVDINAQDSSGRTALHLAVQREDFESLQALLEAGADHNIACKKCETPLFVAVRKGSRKAVSLLLNKGSNPNFQNNLGQSALFFADDTRILRMLQEKGGDLKLRDREWNTILHHATEVNKKPGIISYLLKNDPDLNAVNRLGRTPFLSALANGCESLCNEYLNTGLLDFQKNFNPDLIVQAVSTASRPFGQALRIALKVIRQDNLTQDYTAFLARLVKPLMIKKEYHALESICFLEGYRQIYQVGSITPSADVRKIGLDVDGNNLLHFICHQNYFSEPFRRWIESDRTACLELLQEKNQQGETPLDTLMARYKTACGDPFSELIRGTFAPMLIWMLENGAHPKTFIDQERNTLLHLAGLSMHSARYRTMFTAIRQILSPTEFSAFLEEKNYLGETPLLSLVRKGISKECLQVLLEQKPNLQAVTNNGSNLLHQTAHSVSKGELSTILRDALGLRAYEKLLLQPNHQGLSPLVDAYQIEGIVVDRMLICEPSHPSSTRTRLHYVVSLFEDLNIAREVLKRQPQLLNQTDERKRSPLHYVAGSSHRPDWKVFSYLWLLEKGADPDQVDVIGRTPFELLLDLERAQLAKYFLSPHPIYLEWIEAPKKASMIELIKREEYLENLTLATEKVKALFTLIPGNVFLEISPRYSKDAVLGAFAYIQGVLGEKRAILGAPNPQRHPVQHELFYRELVSYFL